MIADTAGPTRPASLSDETAAAIRRPSFWLPAATAVSRRKARVSAAIAPATDGTNLRRINQWEHSPFPRTRIDFYKTVDGMLQQKMIAIAPASLDGLITALLVNMAKEKNHGVQIAMLRFLHKRLATKLPLRLDTKAIDALIVMIDREVGNRQPQKPPSIFENDLFIAAIELMVKDGRCDDSRLFDMTLAYLGPAIAATGRSPKQSRFGTQILKGVFVLQQATMRASTLISRAYIEFATSLVALRDRDMPIDEAYNNTADALRFAGCREIQRCISLVEEGRIPATIDRLLPMRTRFVLTALLESGNLGPNHEAWLANALMTAHKINTHMPSRDRRPSMDESIFFPRDGFAFAKNGHGAFTATARQSLFPRRASMELGAFLNDHGIQLPPVMRSNENNSLPSNRIEFYVHLQSFFHPDEVFDSPIAPGHLSRFLQLLLANITHEKNQNVIDAQFELLKMTLMLHNEVNTEQSIDIHPEIYRLITYNLDAIKYPGYEEDWVSVAIEIAQTDHSFSDAAMAAYISRYGHYALNGCPKNSLFDINSSDFFVATCLEEEIRPIFDILADATNRNPNLITPEYVAFLSQFLTFRQLKPSATKFYQPDDIHYHNDIVAALQSDALLELGRCMNLVENIDIKPTAWELFNKAAMQTLRGMNRRRTLSPALVEKGTQLTKRYARLVKERPTYSNPEPESLDRPNCQSYTRAQRRLRLKLKIKTQKPVL